MASIVIAGEVIPVNPDADEDINMAMGRADIVLNLETVGYTTERAEEKAGVLIGEGASVGDRGQVGSDRVGDW